MKIKRGNFLLVGMLIMLLGGCDSDTIVQLEGDRISAPLPAGIRQIAALGSLPLEFQVSINGAVTREVRISGSPETVSEVVNMPADQPNDVDLAWFAIVDGRKVLLADFSTTVTPGTTELTVSDYKSDADERFHADSDGRTNLSEARDNRNLLSPFDLEVPLQTSFGGVFATVRDDGIDQDLSGETVEQDLPSRFSLRHDGSNLIVYLCGQDKTLVGDTPGADEQYWHDDAVFIFLDGADSDSNAYDGIDDFQLAFIRETGEKIVTRGGENQFCPGGECISHSFFSNSSSCEYELSVQLPLADLNMTIGSAIGFDLELTDDDNGNKREGSSGWIGFDDRSNEDPGTFGTIVLR